VELERVQCIGLGTDQPHFLSVSDKDVIDEGLEFSCFTIPFTLV
jgi:hypothetical protein